MATTIQKIEIPKKYRALDTSGNNNHGQIYSGRGLEFDGVTDYLTVTDTNALDVTSITAAAWIYVDNFSDENVIIGKGYATGWEFSTDNSTGKLKVNAHVNGAYGGDQHQSSNNLQLSTWYRVVWTYSKSGNVSKFYINGVLDSSATPSAGDGTGLGTNATSVEIGARSATTLIFPGKMSNVQLWNTAWTAADVTYDYLNPESLALNNSGTSLTNSNLKLWYPMQDGHRGQQSYILDGANTGLGSELVLNTSFSGGTLDSSLPTDWEEIGSPTTAVKSIDKVYTGSHSIKVTGDQYAGIDQGQTDTNDRFSTVSGTVYKVTWSGYLNTDSLGTNYLTMDVRDGNGSTQKVSSDLTLVYGQWVHGVKYFTSGATGSSAYIYHVRMKGLSGTARTVYIDNISIKAVNAKNHATTVFYGDELVTNGTFATGDLSDFSVTYATHAIVSEGLKTTIDATGGGQGYGFSKVTFTAVVGRSYRIQVDAQQGTADSTQIKSHSGISLTASDEEGSWSFSGVGVATETTCVVRLQTYGGENDYSIFDNVSIKEEGTATGWTDADQQLHIPQTALQSYNQLAWFDGSDDKLAVAEFNFEDGHSINMWVFINDTSTYRDFFGIAGGTENYMRLDASDPTEKFQFEADDNTVILIDLGAAGVIPEGEWVMWTWLWNADRTIDVYKNGESLGSSAATADSADGTRIKIDSFGNAQAGAINMEGAITEISHYTDLLTQAEINDLYNDGKAKSALEADGSGGLSAYWRNNGLATWIDLTGDGNDGTVTCDETILIPAGVDATRDNQGFLMNKQKDTSCLNLTNSGEYVDLGPVDGDRGITISDSTAYSWTMWVKPDNIDANYIFGSGLSQDWLKIHDSTSIYWRLDDSTNDFTVGTIVAGDWIYVALTKASDDTVKLYVNGTEATGQTYATHNEPFDYRYIGATYNLTDTQYYFKGQIDGFLAYSDVLDSTEVTRNYNAGKHAHTN